MIRNLAVVMVLAVLFVAACNPQAAPPPTAETSIGMPNPASQHCLDQGFELEIRTEDGGEVGYCLFPDGTECEEWAFFRGECAPGESASSSSAPE